jgi:hypothetical protein
VDFSVFKNTKLTERVTFRLEASAYNVLNRSYYGTPDHYQGDASAGSFNNFHSAFSSGQQARSSIFDHIEDFMRPIT